MIRAAGRRPPGLCSRRGACPAGCTPHFLFRLAEKKTGRARSKRKGRLGALRCSGPPRDGGRRIGACADFASPLGTLFSSTRSILPSRGGWCGGRRGGRRIASAPIFAAAGLAVDGSWCGGRMWASARKHKPPRPPRAARSKAERAERGAGQMRPCTPA